jgi:hypothetical protein
LPLPRLHREHCRQSGYGRPDYANEGTWTKRSTGATTEQSAIFLNPEEVLDRNSDGSLQVEIRRDRNPGRRNCGGERQDTETPIGRTCVEPRKPEECNDERTAE